MNTQEVPLVNITEGMNEWRDDFIEFIARAFTQALNFFLSFVLLYRTVRNGMIKGKEEKLEIAAV